ncbi:hypothetical protein glysoja_049388 [Glycine soja]|uniref:Uncharacterized protein n=1 Tax=Glycine soja TaxID=3848 RepID=A0A0B2RMB6_GLYSO|nr:hypothetical protein glysoja_049388 [Glycine soja]
MKNRYATNNETTSSLESDASQSKMVSKHSNLQVKGKEQADMIEGKFSPPAAVQHIHEIRKMKLELEQERKKLVNIQLKLQETTNNLDLSLMPEEEKLNKSFQEELKLLKLKRDKLY